MPVLAVIPSDPLDAYEAVGCHTWLEAYYNPTGFFERVYLLSPLETESGRRYGMDVIPTEPRDLPRRVRELSVDVVRAYGGYWACDMACLNKAAGIPVVVSVHDTNPAELYRSVRRADYVWCMSRAVRDLVLTRYREPSRVWILPNRYDSRVMRPLAREEAVAPESFPETRYGLLCVGRLSEQKNQDTLIRALGILGEEYGCVFVGRNDPAPFRALAQREGVLDRCRFVESVRNDELPRYYGRADAMVTPSRWEGFGIVFIEALACGAVVVTSDVAPMNEYIEDGRNGVLVREYESPSALAESVRRACTDRGLRERLREAAPGSVARFEKARVDALEADYYRSVLAERPVFADRRRGLERCVVRARRWVSRHEMRSGGVAATSKRDYAYPEVTGYLIPTLLDCGERKAAVRLGRWLCGIQNADGSWNGPEPWGAPYAFDTGQILKGLFALRDILPESRPAFERGCGWLARSVSAAGRVETPDDDAHTVPGRGGKAPDAIHLYALEPLLAGARALGRADWEEAVRRALDYYLARPSLTDFACLSHFHAYIIEALLDLGERDRAARAMEDIEALQRDDGAVAGYPDVDWVCSTGVAQYALIWLKLERPGPAGRALAWLRAHQNRSGGFRGSYGEGAEYFADREISWAVKFFLDASRRYSATLALRV